MYLQQIQELKHNEGMAYGMSIPLEEQLNTILTPVFGNEIYPIVHPDPDGLQSSVSNLYAVWTIVGGPKIKKLDGNSNVSRVRVQISIYSIDYTEMKSKQREVDSVMQAANELASQAVDLKQDVFEILGALSNVSESVPLEGREDDTKRYFSHSEFYCWSVN